MKKKVLGILAVSAALMITACNTPSGNSGNNSNPSSSEPAPVTSKEEKQEVRVTGVQLDRNNVSLKPGAYTRLLPTVSPANAANKRVFWTSSNPAIALVDEKGTVTAYEKGSATITCSTYDGFFEATCTVTVENPHAIRVKDDAKVRISVAEKGETDAVINVQVTYDKDKYVLDGVYANGVKCGTNNADFYFVMPDEPVTMEARYHEKPAAVVYKEVASATEGVFIRNVAGGVAQVGAQVEFSFSLIAGLEFDGTVVAKTAGGDNVPLTKVGNYSYSFTMPDDDVEISFAVKAARIPFHKASDDAEKHIKNIKVNGENWNKSYIYYGDAVEVELEGPRSGYYDDYLIEEFLICDQVDMYLANDYGVTPYYFVDDEEVVEVNDDGLTFNFTMPGHEVWFETYMSDRYNEVIIDAPEVLDFVALELYNNRYYRLQEPSVIYGQSLYLVPDFVDGYDARKVYVEPFSYYSYYFGGAVNSSKTSRQELTFDEDLGMYKFDLTRRPAEPIVITVTAKYEEELVGSPLVGEYLALYTWGTNKGESVTTFNGANAHGTIKEDGDMVLRGDEYEYYYFEPLSANGLMIDQATESVARGFMFRDGILYTNNKLNVFSDVYKYVYFQKLNADDADDIYEIRYENINAGKVLCAEVYREGALYKTVYINNDEQIFYTDVAYVMLEGDKITDANAKYAIVKGNKAVGVVSYKGTGGVANRGLVPTGAPFGVFADPTGKYADLELDGLGGVKYDGAEATFISYDPETAELKFADALDNNYTVLLNAFQGTYVVMEIAASPIANLIGKTYSGVGKYYNDYATTIEKDDATYSFKFLEGKKVEASITVGSTTYKATGNKAQGSFTLTGNVLAVTFYATDAAPQVTWQFTVSDDFSTLTPVEGNKSTYFEIGVADWYFNCKVALTAE